MISIESYVRQGQQQLSRWALDERWKTVLRGVSYSAVGFVLSAGSLEQGSLPLSLGFLLACRGWPAVLAGLGSGLGYLVFWGSRALQPILWLAICLPLALILGNHRFPREHTLFFPACAMMTVAVSGLAFQILARENAPVLLYFLRVGTAGVCTWLFHRVVNVRSPTLKWIAAGIGIFSLAQILPTSWLGLGYIAAGALAAVGSFPGAAVAGLGLDLAQVTPVPMTAVIVLAALLRLIPGIKPMFCRLAPGFLGIVFMRLTGLWDLRILPGLFLGGLLSPLFPGPGQAIRRKGEVGAAQVRLELAANVLTQTQQILQQEPLPMPQTASLIARAVERACTGCPCRDGCTDRKALTSLPGSLLEKPLLDTLDIPILCEKPTRLLEELHWAQERFRLLRADRLRQQEYREATVQQYSFLAEYLRSVSDALTNRFQERSLVFDVQTAVFGNRPEEQNADRFTAFSGPGGKYYALLCDGMGSGPGAAEEGRSAITMLRQLLAAGYPPEHALRSLNSLCVLRSLPGAVTADLVQIRLDTGKAKLYKWGASPSFHITKMGAQRVGTVGPPPGYDISGIQERSYSLSLREESVLLLVSDGVNNDEALSLCAELAGSSPAEMGTALLRHCQEQGEDDATVVTLRLKRA